MLGDRTMVRNGHLAYRLADRRKPHGWPYAEANPRPSMRLMPTRGFGIDDVASPASLSGPRVANGTEGMVRNRSIDTQERWG